MDVSAARVGSVAFWASAVLEPLLVPVEPRFADEDEEEPDVDSAERFPAARQLASKATVQVERLREQWSPNKISFFIGFNRSSVRP
jgi:hypothetical protein